MRETLQTLVRTCDLCGKEKGVVVTEEPGNGFDGWLTVEESPADIPVEPGSNSPIDYGPWDFCSTKCAAAFLLKANKEAR